MGYGDRAFMAYGGMGPCISKMSLLHTITIKSLIIQQKVTNFTYC